MALKQQVFQCDWRTLIGLNLFVYTFPVVPSVGAASKLAMTECVYAYINCSKMTLYMGNLRELGFIA